MTTQLKYKIGNVVEQTFDEPTLLIHVCNVYNGYGSGVAGAISRRFPIAKTKYHQWYNLGLDRVNPFMLGRIQTVKVSDSLTICNMLGQAVPGGDNFRINGQNVSLRPIRLDSIRECLLRVAKVATDNGVKVVGPMFGGGLSGGDFDLEIIPLIEECLLKYDIDVTIYKLE